MMPPRIASRSQHQQRYRDQALVADQQDLDQHDGEEDRERIVGAGFDLERGADARPQPQAARHEQEEHRRGVGRGHHRADQQRLDPAQMPSTRLATGAVSAAVTSTPTVASSRRRRQHVAEGREAACAGRRRTGSAPSATEPTV